MTATAISTFSTSNGLASTGIGSGLDVNSIVSKLMATEQQPLTDLQNKGNTLSTKLSAYGTVKSQLAALQDAATTLMDSTGWSGRTFTSSNTSAVTGSASNGATPGTYDVTVSQLAQIQTNYSNGVTTGQGIGADSSGATSGYLSISLGTWTGANTFNAGSAAAINVSVSSTDTISSIASKINAANAGINASVVTANGKDQLIIRGNNTGAAQGFQIQAFEGTPSAPGTAITDGSGFGMLAYAPSTATGATGPAGGLTLHQAAQDAQANIDGIAVSSGTNTITTAIPNVTLTLAQTSTTPLTVTVANDTATETQNVQTFVNAYNALASNLGALTAYDASTKTAGPLQGNATAIGILNTLQRMVSTPGPSGTGFTYLSDAGIQMQANGTLAINSTKLNAALSNPSQLQSFFGATSTDPTATGLARRFYNYAFGANSVSGNVTAATNSIQTQITNNNNDITNMNNKLQADQARLYAQFTALDTQMASLNSLSSYVTQQVTTWNKGG